MIMNTTLGLLTAACLGFGGISVAANASIIFQDDFDTEAGAIGASVVNFNSFSKWTVSDGSVDVVANGGWGINCAGGRGKCVDLDGSTNNSGILTSHELLLGAGSYSLSFDMAGNQRSGSDNMTMNLGSYISRTFSLASTDPWQTIISDFTVDTDSATYLSFANEGGDNIGIMLDNVVLRSVASPDATDVPEPASWSLLGLGLLSLCFARRMQKNQGQGNSKAIGDSVNKRALAYCA